MAQKRMFSQSIVLSDDFLDMPASTRCLYFCFGMLADDDGFVNNPKSIMRQCGCSSKDFKLLLSKGYIHLFKTGVVVIMHWRINNYIRTDRYTPTKCIDEKAQLFEDDNGAYSLTGGIPLGIPDGLPTGRQAVYTDKSSIDKNSIEGADKPPHAHFVSPTLDEVKAYFAESGLNGSPERFFGYYSGIGWKTAGGAKITDWKGMAVAWSSSEKIEKEDMTAQKIEKAKKQERDHIVPDAFKDRFGDNWDAYDEWRNQ